MTHQNKTSKISRRSIRLVLGFVLAVMSFISVFFVQNRFGIPVFERSDVAQDVAQDVAIAQVPPVPTVPLTPSPTSPIASPTANPTVSPTPPAGQEGVPIDPLPGSRTTPPVPNPTATATPTAAPLPLPPPPQVIIPVDAQALPTAGTHKDAANRFQISLLKGYRVTPLGDSVLVEAPNGRLAYTVLAQSAAQLGFLSGVALTPENLAQVVRNTWSRGEGFQTELPQAIDNGIQMNWSGILTIGGKPQPMTGVIIAKPGLDSILMLTIAATEQGKAEIPGALSSLVPSLVVP